MRCCHPTIAIEGPYSENLLEGNQRSSWRPPETERSGRAIKRKPPRQTCWLMKRIRITSLSLRPRGNGHLGAKAISGAHLGMVNSPPSRRADWVLTLAVPLSSRAGTRGPARLPATPRLLRLALARRQGLASSPQRTRAPFLSPCPRNPRLFPECQTPSPPAHRRRPAPVPAR